MDELDRTTAEEVRDLWIADLTLGPPPKTGPQAAAGEHLLRNLLRTASITILHPDPERTWLWSDLHLGDRAMLEAWDRPFRSVTHMNRRCWPSGAAVSAPGRRSSAWATSPTSTLGTTTADCGSTSPAARASGCSSSGTTTSTCARGWRPPDSNGNARQPSATPIPYSLSPMRPCSACRRTP